MSPVIQDLHGLALISTKYGQACDPPGQHNSGQPYSCLAVVIDMKLCLFVGPGNECEKTPQPNPWSRTSVWHGYLDQAYPVEGAPRINAPSLTRATSASELGATPPNIAGKHLVSVNHHWWANRGELRLLYEYHRRKSTRFAIFRPQRWRRGQLAPRRCCSISCVHLCFPMNVRSMLCT